MLILAYLALSWLGKSLEHEIQLCQEQSEAENQVSPQSEYQKVQEFVLEPGQKPVTIPTKGKKFHWEHYQVGNEGEPILLIRFILVNGDVTPWENISNQWLESWQLPDRRSIQAVEFGVPKEGRTEGLEVRI